MKFHHLLAKSLSHFQLRRMMTLHSQKNVYLLRHWNASYILYTRWNSDKTHFKMHRVLGVSAIVERHDHRYLTTVEGFLYVNIRRRRAISRNSKRRSKSLRIDKTQISRQVELWFSIVRTQFSSSLMRNSVEKICFPRINQLRTIAILVSKRGFFYFPFVRCTKGRVLDWS